MKFAKLHPSAAARPGVLHPLLGMKTDKLPPSECVEDRRNDKPSKPRGMTFAEMLEWAANKRRLYKPNPDSKLALEAGVDDIKPKPGDI